MDIASPVSSNKHLLSACWDPKQAAANILEGLINVCEPSVKGAHDADFVIVNDRAYIVYEANDIQPGENPTWPFIYCVMSIVNLNTLEHLICSPGIYTWMLYHRVLKEYNLITVCILLTHLESLIIRYMQF